MKRRRTTRSRASTTASRLQWGPNTLIYNTKKVKPAPTSWSAIYGTEVQGQDHCPEQPDPDRGCGALPAEDEAVTRDQGSVRADEAAVRCRSRVAPAAAAELQRYWRRTRPRTSRTTRRATRSSARRGPTKPAAGREGAGQGDRPERGRDRLGRHVDAHEAGAAPELRVPVDGVAATPQVQAQQALVFGETPVNPKACPYMNKIQKGSCAGYHLDAPASYRSRFASGRHLSAPAGGAVATTAWIGRPEQRLGVDYRLTRLAVDVARGEPPPGGPGLRLSGVLLAEAMAEAPRTPRPPGRRVHRRLRGVARSDVRLVVLDERLVHRRDRPHAGRSISTGRSSSRRSGIPELLCAPS